MLCYVMYSASTYDVVNSYLTLVWDKKIRNGYVILETRVLCNKMLKSNEIVSFLRQRQTANKPANQPNRQTNIETYRQT